MLCLRTTAKEVEAGRCGCVSGCVSRRVSGCVSYCLVWATELLLAAIGLVFPVLVLGFKSFDCSMYQVPVPTLIE
jgi:hypothetical protein